MNILEAIKQQRDDIKEWTKNNLVSLDNKIDEIPTEIFVGEGQMPQEATIQIITDGSDEEQAFKDELIDYINQELATGNYDGKSAYQYAKENGYAGTEAEFAEDINPDNIKAEANAYIADELAKRGQLKPEFVNSVDELEETGDTTKLYVLPDGYIYGYINGVWMNTGRAFVPADYEDRILALEEHGVVQTTGGSETNVMSQAAVTKCFDSLSGDGVTVYFPNGFVQGNLNTNLDKFETVSYAIRSVDVIKVSGTLKFKINDDFCAYVTYIEDGDFIGVHTIDGNEHYENGSVSQTIINKDVYIVIAKKDLSNITVDELEDVGLEVYRTSPTDELANQIKNLYGIGKPLVLEGEFVQGNVNTVSNKFENVEYAIRSGNAISVNGALRFEMNAGYRAYIAYIDGDDFINIVSTNNTAYFKNGFVSKKIDNKLVYITIIKDNMVTITVDELENVGLKIFLAPCANEIKPLSTFAHSRKGAKLLPADHSWNTIFEHTGEGVLENMFFAGDFDVKRTKLKITVDDIITSVSGFLYELVGLLADRNNNDIFGNELFGKTGDKNGIYLNYKVPFYKNIKIEIANDIDTTNPYVWFNARVSSWHKITVAGVDIPYGAYFYCTSQYKTNVESGEEITLYDNKYSNGVITNINMSASGATSSWYQEGMIRAYVGNSTEPQLISSGLEDYFLGTYYFRTGTYHLPVAGCSFIDTTTEHLFSGYRLHTHDLLAHGSGGYRLTVRNSDINVEGASSILNPTLANYRWYVGRYEW